MTLHEAGEEFRVKQLSLNGIKWGQSGPKFVDFLTLLLLRETPKCPHQAEPMWHFLHFLIPFFVLQLPALPHANPQMLASGKRQALILFSLLLSFPGGFPELQPILFFVLVLSAGDTWDSARIPFSL